jgi:acetyltransferase-like isoleucine patch superfamily enzyme
MRGFMLTDEDRAKRKAEREALRIYCRGSQDRPFVLERNDAYYVCEVLFPSVFDQIRIPIRCLMMGIVNAIPISTLKVFFYRVFGMKIGKGVYIAPGTLIDPLSPWLIELGDDCFLGMGCKIFTHEYTATCFRMGRVRIGRGSVIGAYSIIRSGVTIGEKVTVGFNSYVNQDIGDGETVGGVPAKPLRPGPERGS